MIRRGLLLCAILALAPAEIRCNAAAKPADAQEPTRDFIRLDPNNPRANFVKIEIAEESVVSPAVRLTGRIAFDENHTERVSSPIDARAMKVLVQVGDTVKRGQPLLQMSSSHVSQGKTDAQNAGEDRSDAGKPSSARLRAQPRSIGLSVSGSNARVSLRSSIAGTIVERNVLVGQEIRAYAANPLFTITDLSAVWVLADLDEQELASARQGDRINVRVPAYPDRSFLGTVEHVGEVLDTATHTAKVRCAVPNPEMLLKPEMLAKVELAEPRQGKGMLLPSKALLTDGEHASVVIASEGNVYRQRFVETGLEVDGRVQILNGVTPGERVVTDGAIFLRGAMLNRGTDLP
jgi:cobalt-zinc-cadmium efflux system membrane fusion protein